MLISTTPASRSGVQPLDAWLIGYPDAETEALLAVKAPVTLKVFYIVAALLLAALFASMVLMSATDDALWPALLLSSVACLGWIAYVANREKRAGRRAEFLTSSPDVVRLDRDVTFQLLRPDLAPAESWKQHKGYIDLYFRLNEDRNQALREDPDLVLIRDDLYNKAIDHLISDAVSLAERMEYRGGLDPAHQLFWHFLSLRRQKRDEQWDSLNRRVSVEVRPGGDG